jgi:hypothetical protein
LQQLEGDNVVKPKELYATEMEKEAHALFGRSRKDSAKATVDVSELK